MKRAMQRGRGRRLRSQPRGARSEPTLRRGHRGWYRSTRLFLCAVASLVLGGRGAPLLIFRPRFAESDLRGTASKCRGARWGPGHAADCPPTDSSERVFGGTRVDGACRRPWLIRRASRCYPTVHLTESRDRRRSGSGTDRRRVVQRSRGPSGVGIDSPVICRSDRHSNLQTALVVQAEEVYDTSSRGRGCVRPGFG